VRRLGPTAIAIVVVLIVSCVGAGCGGDVGAKEDGEVAITITSRAYPEEEVLREIYGQALEAAGFKVKRREIETGVLPPEELEKGRVSGYPDHLETALTEITPVRLEEVPGAADAAYREAKEGLEDEGLVPFPPASFVRTNAVGVLKETAEKEGLATLSDLKGPSREMSVIEWERYCHGRANCLGGLERHYGIVFEAYSAIAFFEPSSLAYKALRTGEADAAVLINTQGRIARAKSWLVLLEDDEHRLPAANAFWLTSQDVVDEAGPDYEKTIVAAQKGLTTKVMRELNAEVELEGKAPGEVAAEYLKSIHFRG
jgi:glycine betaine/choline ABC-type transport system substrate-binding protein